MGKETLLLILVARVLRCSAPQMQVLAVLLAPRTQPVLLTSRIIYLVGQHPIRTYTMGFHLIRSLVKILVSIYLWIVILVGGSGRTQI